MDPPVAILTSSAELETVKALRSGFLIYFPSLIDLIRFLQHPPAMGMMVSPDTTSARSRPASSPP